MRLFFRILSASGVADSFVRGLAAVATAVLVNGSRLLLPVCDCLERTSFLALREEQQAEMKI